MSLVSDTIITRPIHHHGIKKKRENHILFERLDGTENVRIKGKKLPEAQYLDNYKYLETKEIKENHGRSRSIVKHIRLNPSGIESPFDREIYNTYNTYTTYTQKKPIITNINTNTQRVYRPTTEYKYSQKTSNIRQNKFNTLNSREGEYPSSNRNNKEKTSSVIFSSNIQTFSNLEPKYNIEGREKKSGKNKQIKYSVGLNSGERKYNEYQDYKSRQNNYDNTEGRFNLNSNKKEEGKYNLNNQRFKNSAQNTRIELGTRIEIGSVKEIIKE